MTKGEMARCLGKKPYKTESRVIFSTSSVESKNIKRDLETPSSLKQNMKFFKGKNLREVKQDLTIDQKRTMASILG